MKLSGKLICAGAFLFLFYTAPAFAQFEINPDHFDMVNQAPPKTSIASKRKTEQQHLGTRAAASLRLRPPNSVAQQARTSSSENAQATSAQPHGHTHKAPLSAKAAAKVQPLRRTAQVAQVPRE